MTNKIYKDTNGNPYEIGDIVFNPFMGDFWVVQNCTDEEKEMYGLETDICLALNNDKDDYAIDIDEPAGFKIFLRPSDEHYVEAIEELRQIAEKRKRWLENE